MSERSPHQSRVPRIPLNTLAIAFGLSGLASLWSTVSDVLGMTAIIPAALWCAAAVAWVWLIIAHILRGLRSQETLGSQLKHPAQGPIAAIVPIVGILLGAKLHAVWPLAGTVLALASIVVATVLAGWMLAFWHTGKLNPEAIHGAYLLPLVGAPLVASEVTAELGLPGIAVGAFAVGVLFWVVLLTLLLSRLAFLPPLPDALTPTLAILIAPPAIAGAAWFAMNGKGADMVSIGLLGVLALMLVMQLFLLSIYRQLQFSLGFWSFTFPAAAASSYGIQWIVLTAFDGWEVATVAVAAAATLLIGAVGIRSLVLVAQITRGARRAEESLRRADDDVCRSPATAVADP